MSAPAGTADDVPKYYKISNLSCGDQNAVSRKIHFHPFHHVPPRECLSCVLSAYGSRATHSAYRHQSNYSSGCFVVLISCHYGHRQAGTALAVSKQLLGKIFEVINEDIAKLYANGREKIIVIMSQINYEYLT